MTTWSDAKALCFAKSCLELSDDPARPGTTQLCRAVIRLSAKVAALTIDVDDLRILLAFAADRSAAKDWPATVQAIERVLAKYGAL